MSQPDQYTADCARKQREAEAQEDAEALGFDNADEASEYWDDLRLQTLMQGKTN